MLSLVFWPRTLDRSYNKALSMTTIIANIQTETIKIMSNLAYTQIKK